MYKAFLSVSLETFVLEVSILVHIRAWNGEIKKAYVPNVKGESFEIKGIEFQNFAVHLCYTTKNNGYRQIQLHNKYDRRRSGIPLVEGKQDKLQRLFCYSRAFVAAIADYTTKQLGRKYTPAYLLKWLSETK